MPLRPPTAAGPALSAERSASQRRRSRAASLLVATVALSVPLFAGAAHAADCKPANGLSTCIDADNLWTHAGAGPFFALGPTQTTPAAKVSFGLVMSYLSRPIGLRIGSPDPGGATSYAID